VKFADEQVTSGDEAQAYASYIGGHLEGIADGKTYAEIDDRGAAAAVVEARESGASEAKIAELQATADELKGQRDSLFRGETLRGLLLSSYAWSTIGRIAGIAAWVAFAGAAVMAALTVAGVVHVRRTKA
jgi:phage terminase Nu1 subunit (DNA packaging protein)